MSSRFRYAAKASRHDPPAHRGAVAGVVEVSGSSGWGHTIRALEQQLNTAIEEAVTDEVWREGQHLPESVIRANVAAEVSGFAMRHLTRYLLRHEP